MAPFHLAVAFLGVLAQQDFGNDQFSDEQAAAQAAGALCQCFIMIIVAIPTIIGMWKIFVKAGKPGWAAIIPIYNFIVLLEIVGRPVWWFILLFIPCVGFIIQIIIYLDLAKSFGRGSGFGIGLVFLPFIFFPILGFGDARYLGPAVPQPGSSQM
ncbi:MAG: signal peptidase I [Planctomycetaceae bacterium]|nr:signal peptidase I [Planctomycetaceae bacterium]